MVPHIMEKMMTNSQGSKFSYALAYAPNYEYMELLKAVEGMDFLYTEEIGKTHDITPSGIKKIFEETYKELFDRELKIITYREFGPNYGAIAQYEQAVLFLDCNQTYDKAGYIKVRIYAPSVSVVSALAAVFSDALAPHIYEAWDEIAWMYKAGVGNIEEATFPIKRYDDVMPEVYPFIGNGKFNEWVEGYLNSSSNVLIMNGPMGTGKSSLIAHLIREGRCAAMTAFDLEVMRTDGLYTQFIGGEYDMLILEDADLMLLERVSGDNDTMSKLLNVSEGIIDTTSKKIIFTANLENIAKIDPALRRPGRCYDIVEFRALTKTEANVARVKLGKKEFTTDRDYTLAEVYQK